MIERVNPPELARPAGFAHAVVGSGTIVFLAGQTAMAPDGSIVGTDVVNQFETALGNLLKALHAAGGEPRRSCLAHGLRGRSGRLPTQRRADRTGVAAADRA